MDKTSLNELFEEHLKAARCPSPGVVSGFFNRLLGFLFPEFSSEEFRSAKEFESYLESLKEEFFTILKRRTDHDAGSDQKLTDELFSQLPDIRKALKLDIQAMFDGDPAARSNAEVVRSYPGFYALASYRIARVILERDLPLIARMITSHAHNRTGIDIHPGAQIGSYCCIDHGTGIVIGETTRVGDHVKIYQGVTLGALSVRKEDAAIKRHPTIEDYVVLYAGASILGGETVVGHHSVIGGNVWLTKSVPPHSRVYYRAQFVNLVDEDKDKVTL
ncbi:MAG: serine O-acetyltransferase [Balneolaceae bacterium]